MYRRWIKTIPKKNKCKKSKMAVRGGLTIAVKSREVKSKEKRQDIPI